MARRGITSRYYLDFQKAFDKVPHQRLLLKLKACGIRDGIIDWIEQWLTDRRQCVAVDGEISNWITFLGGTNMPSLRVFPVDYRFFISSTGLSVGRTFLTVFAILGGKKFSPHFIGKIGTVQ